MNKKVSEAVPHLKSKGMKAPKSESMHMNMPHDVRANKLEKEGSQHLQKAASEGHAKQDMVRESVASKGGDAQSARSRSSMPFNAASHPMQYSSEVGNSAAMQDGNHGAKHDHSAGAEAHDKAPDMNEGKEKNASSPGASESKHEALRKEEDK